MALARRGIYANRNSGHREYQLKMAARAAGDPWELLRVRFDGFRAAARLLARRRPQRGVPQSEHRAAADRLVREVSAYLADLTGRINAGEFDVSREDVA